MEYSPTFTMNFRPWSMWDTVDSKTDGWKLEKEVHFTERAIEKNVDFATSSTIRSACWYGCLVGQICSQWVVATQFLWSKNKMGCFEDDDRFNYDGELNMIKSSAQQNGTHSGISTKDYLMQQSYNIIPIDGRKKHKVFPIYMVPST